MININYHHGDSRSQDLWLQVKSDMVYQAAIERNETFSNSNTKIVNCRLYLLTII